MLPIPRRVLPAAALAVLAALAALAFAAGCSEDGGPLGPAPVYSSITITGADTVLVDSTVVFTAVVLDTAGQVVVSPELVWSTSAGAIATVNNAGTVRGVSEGDALIQASGGGAQSNFESIAVLQGRGWVDQSDAVASLVNLNGVHFVSARTGWIVGDQGTILRTVNAGGTWTAQVSNSTNYTLNDVAFATTSIGIVVGSAGRILRTTNGGVTWTALLGVDTDGGRGLNDVYFQDPDRGWIVGNGGLILRTNNGGSSWTRVLPGVTANDLESVSFPRNTTFGTPPADPWGRGWIAGGAGILLGSDDFGQSWRIVTPFVTTDPLFGVARRSTADAIAVGANNRVAATFASADTALWALAPPPTPFSNLTAVAWPVSAPAPGPAWAVGKSVAGAVPVVFVSDDAGLTWTPQDLPSDAPLLGNGLEDVFFLDERRGWAVGSQGLVLHTATGGR
jgi:photosystem II stability/assembly factor-like uncharacterized protein